MKLSEGEQAIRELALRKGLSEAEIRRAIEIVIDLGLSNPDLAVQA